MWTSKELHDSYLEKGGTESNKSRFLNKIVSLLQSEVHVFHSPGIAPLLIHKKKASSMFKLVASHDEEDDNNDVKSVAKKIQQEIKAMTINKSNYTPVTSENIFDNCSETLKMLLCSITSKFENSLPTAMIGSIITNMVTGIFTPLQLSLGLYIHEKSKINELQRYLVTSTYDEIRRFRLSASLAADDESTKLKLDANNGMIQYISDNFDAQICSQNGLKQTHGLASVVTQPMSEMMEKAVPIPRAPKMNVSDVQLSEISKKTFTGPKTLK